MLSNYYFLDKNFDIKKEPKKKIRKNKPSKFSNKENILLAKYTNIGYYLITPLIIGVFLGLYLDNKFRINYLVIIGIIIGGISAIYNLFRLLK